jgi:hypothetical protein
MRRSFYLVILISFFACSFLPTIQAKSPAHKQYNYVIVLDLSDRLLEKDQWKIDTCLIGTSIRTFIGKVKKELTYINATDCHFKVKIPRYNGLNQDLSVYQDALELDLISALSNAKKISDYNANYSKVLVKLYSSVLHNKKQSSDFKGTDIWSFFNYDLKNSLSTNSNVENRILVITDGYFDFEPGMPQKNVGPLSSSSNNFFSKLRAFNLNDQELLLKAGKIGLIPVKVPQLSNSKIAIVELNSKSKNYLDEIEMLQLNWNYWMIRSGVKFGVQLQPKESLNMSRSFVRNFFLK